jgi:O-antigen/teichoic acid export membrane protein
MSGHDEIDLTGPVEPIEPHGTLEVHPEELAPAPDADASAEPGTVGLRRRAARGTLINGVFLIALTALGLIRGFVLARFLTKDDYGIWAVLVTSFGTLVFLKEVGVSDKYIQQGDLDQERAFQRAFTLEFIMTSAVTLLIAIAIPFVAWAYGRWEIVPVGFVGLLAIPALALQAPLWIWYRRMDYFKQRLISAADPIVGFVVAVSLAAAGAGYWALVGGLLAGAWGTSIIAVATSPYKLRFALDGAVVREYVSFSLPILAASMAGLVVAQGSIIATSATLGVAGAGVVALASTVIQFADRVDAIVSGTLYPAICRVADRTDVLFESFVKSNRLALMWAMPFGVGLALFAEDLVRFGIGEKWRPAIPLLQAFGLIAAVNHLGFNWTSYFRARADTRPIAVTSAVTTIAFVVLTLPLLIFGGLEGFAYGMAAMMLAQLVCRTYYLRRLFTGFRLLPHAVRAITPVLPGVAVVLLIRAVDGGQRTGLMAGAQLVLFAGVVLVATVVAERVLLREALGYLRRQPAATATA